MSCASKARFLRELARRPAAWVLLAGVLVAVGGAVASGAAWWWSLGGGLVSLGGLGWVGCDWLAAAERTALNARALTALDGEPGPRQIAGIDGAVLFANTEALKNWGHRWAGAALAERLDAEPWAEEALHKLVSSARSGLPQTADLPFRTRQGTREWMRVAVRPLKTFGDSEMETAVLWAAQDTTAQHVIEDVFLSDRRELTEMFDHLPVGLFARDGSGRLTYVNQRLAEWLGFPANDLQGRTLAEIAGPPPLGAPDAPEDTGQPHEMRFATAEGATFDAFVSHTRALAGDGNAVIRSVVVRDVMPEKEWAQALREAERRFRWLFDDAPVGIALVDLNGLVNQCNRAFLRMTGSARDATLGKPLDTLIAREDRTEVAAVLSKIVMGTLPAAQTEVRLAGPRELVASLFVSPIGRRENVSGLVLHFIDTTEHKSLEVQFAQAQKMQAMGQLAGGVAHDFNNLLTAMIGFCDLLLQRHQPGDPSFPDLMQIKQNANRAASLVRQLLAFSRRQPLQPRELDVTEALSDVSHLLHRLLGESVELKMVHGRDIGKLRVDPGQFDQVIINLAVNARDAMAGGGLLAIRSRMEKIAEPTQRGVEIIPPGDYVVIEVADTGEGIPKENLTRIFEPFFTTKEKEGGSGTGLGLATVYGIVRQTDGFIFVDSAPGEGATFTIYLPRYVAPPVAELPPESPKAKAAAKTRKAEDKGQMSLPLTAGSVPAPETGPGGDSIVLLVEDEDPVRVFSARALKNKGYTVLEADSGETALEVLAETDHVDLLITDMMMPGMGGASLARRVLRDRPEIRILLISGYSEDVARGEFNDQPDIHFLAKPFNLAQLVGTVKQVLTRKRQSG